jgi:hypothetical protein
MPARDIGRAIEAVERGEAQGLIVVFQATHVALCWNSDDANGAAPGRA